jgi:hypothetical protein
MFSKFLEQESIDAQKKIVHISQQLQKTMFDVLFTLYTTVQLILL